MDAAPLLPRICFMSKKKYVVCLTKAFEKDVGDSGYGIEYHKEPLMFLDGIKKMLT